MSTFGPLPDSSPSGESGLLHQPLAWPPERTGPHCHRKGLSPAVLFAQPLGMSGFLLPASCQTCGEVWCLSMTVSDCRRSQPSCSIHPLSVLSPPFPVLSPQRQYISLTRTSSQRQFVRAPWEVQGETELLPTCEHFSLFCLISFPAWKTFSGIFD